MNRTVPMRAFLTAALVLGLSAAALAQPKSPEELTRAAQLIFRGTIQELGASNLTIVQADSSMAVVRVDEVLKAAPGLDDFTGREITVKLAQPNATTLGEQAVFFTRSWIYGETLGVVEVGRLHGEASLLRSQVATAMRQVNDDELRGRLAGAALIVAGRVVETHPAVVVGEIGEGSEHDPQWWEAVVQVDTVFKGKPAEQRVTFLYPTSRDVLWYEAPKPVVGSDGIWLLYRDQLPDLHLAGYSALKPWNFQPRGKADSIRRLLGQ